MRIQTGQFVRRRFVALALGLLLTSAGEVAADAYYIATDGDDGNSGTIASPFGTSGSVPGSTQTGNVG